MSAAQLHITDSTPLGATVVDGDGVTFSLWAPGATAVSVVLAGDPVPPGPDRDLVKDDATGRWRGFLPDAAIGTRYRFFVTGPGGSGLKRDPWARELDAGYPDCDCIVAGPAAYPWHDQDFSRPAANELVVYQLHIGVFYAVDEQGQDLRPHRAATFLDALGRVPYLADLGVTAVQPLPVVEFHGEWSLGYNGVDLFSPERDYTVGTADLPRYVDDVNTHLAAHGHRPMTLADLDGQVAQLKVFVDVCHLYGLAVLFDVVYNHAGGGLDEQSLDYLDFPAVRDGTTNLYFSANDWAGGRVFDFGKAGVRDFLIGNAELLLSEYHGDGLRCDEVTVIDMFGGWSFCQQLTQTLHSRFPGRTLIAEYWGGTRWLATAPPPTGMGFDLGYADGLRDAVRGVLHDAEAGEDAPLSLQQLAGGLLPPPNLASATQAYTCTENQDLVLDADGDHRHPRIPVLADPSNTRSWYARSRSRVAMAALLTGAGTPMLFMGQELFEDKLWSDDFHETDRLIWWGGLDSDTSVIDFHRYVRDLLGLRQRMPALRSDGLVISVVDDANRIVVLHRWVPGEGDDVFVVLSLNEHTIWDGGFALGLPYPGTWHEAFNSDLYDHFPNPQVAGNGGSVQADAPGLHGFDQSARLTVPANAVLVLSRSVQAPT